MVQPLWKTAWRFLKKLKIELPYDPGIPLLDMYNGIEIRISKRYLHSHVHCRLFPTATWKQTKCPSIDKWIKKLCYIHAMEYHSVLKKEAV